MKRFKELYNYPVCRDNCYLIKFYQKRVLACIDAISHIYALRGKYTKPLELKEYDKLIDGLFKYKSNAKRKRDVILHRCDFNDRTKEIILEECNEEFHNGIRVE